MILPTVSMRATTYGAAYQGQPLGCFPREVYGYYDLHDPTIAAISPSEYAQWPCGPRLRIEGPAGAISVVRKDSCPGCDKHGLPHLIDLSLAGHAAVCGRGTCVVQVTRIAE